MGSETSHMGVDTLDSVLRWRCIGPPRGGRTVAVAGHPTDSNVFYFGACSGGVWRTSDGGTYWENVSDGFFNTAAVGAIAVSESDPNVIYAGTGEACIRNDVSHGDGVYRSTDGGQTWRNVGLNDTRHIARIRVHPDNPDLVYVAAFGHVFGTNSQRGVFRSANGGESWERILFKSEKAGAADLSMDPRNPRILYASIWEGYRSFWEVSSGGTDSGLYRSADGGDTWMELTDSPGMPAGLKGRIGVAASPAKPGRVWALVEAEEGGLLRSDDSGATWEMLNTDGEIKGRAWYYSHLFAHPTDPETVWSLCWLAWKSSDGGRTFEQVTTPHDDNHDLWIDPRNPDRMIEGNDGGACVSYNGGATWSNIYNQPTAQFYHMATDDQFPYRVYGTQQDNSAISVPSQSHIGAILWGDSYLVGSSESGHIAVKPDNPNVVYSGAIGSTPGGGAPILRYDHSTKQVRAVTVWPEGSGSWPPKEQKYRFSWSFPLSFSPHDSGVLYTAANIVFRSTDEGNSWEPISPDLTRDDPTKQELSGGPITAEGGAIEMYCTISAFAESPHEQGVFWAGSDDGLVHISRDGGETWVDVTPPGLPEWSFVRNVEPSPHAPGVAYLAATRHKLDDYRPFLYKTEDYGKTWSQIIGGLPDDTVTRVIREDTARRGLLYVGTETGVIASLDDGETWQPLRAGLPVAPVHDMAVKGDDLVVATHGRSFWILGDLPLIRQLDAAALAAPAHLFGPAQTYRLLPQLGLVPGTGAGKNFSAGTFGTGGTYVQKPATGGERVFLDAGTNPPAGVSVVFHLSDAPKGEVKLSFADHRGDVVKTFSTKDERRGLNVDVGMNRFLWDMRYPDAEPPLQIGAPSLKSVPPPIAPLATPGEYRVELSVDGRSFSQPFEILQDPRGAASAKDLEDQFELLVAIRDRLSDARRAVRQIDRVRGQIEEWEGRSEGVADSGSVREAAGRLREALSAIEGRLITVKRPGTQGRLAQITEKLESLAPVVSSTDAAPTRQSYEVFEELAAGLDEQLARLRDLIDTDLAVFATMIGELGIPAIAP
ncbi:MAG: glycosyl hydrolase [Chloroflexi bacterium]|nr:glycosyl hydrolase [Chloroflexota bacterium]